MSTYDHQRILTDWSNGTLTADMAIGHALQHIDGLYARQKTLQNKVNHLENKMNVLQTQLDRLTKGVSMELEQKTFPAPTPRSNLLEVKTPARS